MLTVKAYFQVAHRKNSKLFFNAVCTKWYCNHTLSPLNHIMLDQLEDWTNRLTFSLLNTCSTNLIICQKILVIYQHN